MYEFWYNYIKPKYGSKVNLYYMNTGRFIVSIKSENVYEDTTDLVQIIFDTLNYKIKRPVPIGENKKVMGLMKEELNGKITTVSRA